MVKPYQQINEAEERISCLEDRCFAISQSDNKSKKKHEKVKTGIYEVIKQMSFRNS